LARANQNHSLSVDQLKELQINREQMQKIIASKDRNLIQLLRQMQQKENGWGCLKE
jgi:hypothetical protein